MDNQKTLYVIPGYGESHEDNAYQDAILLAHNKGYIVKKIEISWDTDKVMDDYVAEALSQIKENEGEMVSGLGFSFGAYILALISPIINFNSLFFCSLSPYFKDDLINIPEEAKKELGEKFIKNIEKNVFPNISKAKAVFLVGENDWPQALDRTNKSFNLWQGQKEIVRIPNVGHDFGTPEYKNALSKVL